MISPAIQLKLKDLLLYAKGDQQEAERLVWRLIEKDTDFLRDLVEPFLKGIVVHSLSASIKAEHPRHQTVAKTAPITNMDAIVRTLDENMPSTPVGGNKASSRHVDAIKAISLAQAKRKKAETGNA